MIPSVLAILGDNPMQSEICCHRGMTAKKFCRICWVTGDADDDGELEGEPVNIAVEASGDFNGSESAPSSPIIGRTRRSTLSTGSSQTHAAEPSEPKQRRRKTETLKEMMERISNFMVVRLLDVGTSMNVASNSLKYSLYSK